jgi:amino acid permease|tara:strand:- start:170 stop:373 length:204 start_codon:yes stop_codon:yes gene_type:complete
MYQINVPALYTELKERNVKNFEKVLGYGTLLACVCYISAGIFGWVTFAATPDVSVNGSLTYKEIFLM